MKNLFLATCIIVLLVMALSCSKTPDVVIEPDKLFYQPSNFQSPVYKIQSNPVTKEGFELGKSLFYDGILSRDGTISCGECHRQDFGFTHHLHDLSHGIDNQIGLRNSSSLQNLAWEKTFGWDGGVFDLDLFAISPIENPVEMDEKTSNVLEKLRKSDKYPNMFKNAFGTTEITSERFLKALSQFLLSLISANSKYDKYTRKEAGVVFSDSELAGMELFKQKCSSCHAGELFSDGSYRNNGLPPTERQQVVYRIVDGVKKAFIEPVIDDGRMRVTELQGDKNKFKVPSLRNVEATKPYMHDGRLQTLDEVLNHYTNTVTATQNIDPILNQNGKLGIPLTATEKAQIITFLRTLTDRTFLEDKRFTPQ
ncbi:MULTISPECIES: cytochrome c peroxidase [unclassified Arcicella]|uniref:cytochrome-c peroxidase n=1 Tax=unclassified Arcicella TaxID=2644986 RepID=UPI0028651DDF|nr:MULTISPECIES: cytochrome c peroxidase [unclassified Arcicella]MDR6560202.1 cytochrome c peroxidase [Arcicella sp. BE51]MDR6810191.1 cytochrome c peroxidase [Arcicella sp. BE140]MDR6821541.1 cytochrome c peroxidase [Arcicella sp. BE139]